MEDFIIDFDYIISRLRDLDGFNVQTGFLNEMCREAEKILQTSITSYYGFHDMHRFDHLRELDLYGGNYILLGSAFCTEIGCFFQDAYHFDRVSANLFFANREVSYFSFMLEKKLNNILKSMSKKSPMFNSTAAAA